MVGYTSLQGSTTYCVSPPLAPQDSGILPFLAVEYRESMTANSQMSWPGRKNATASFQSDCDSQNHGHACAEQLLFK